ncbi:response regulator [Brevundimonas sp.]|uniref:response regulator n=1 Tax=Brevundimonas sp. TaxID=1871086 RepID=UPI0017DCAF8E|nr:response regulator [Brevundimonas sp.]MBA4807825.1 response regulator [Brevundimonas sp.]
MFTADARTLSRIEPAIRRIVIVEPNASSARLLSDIMKGLGAREVYVAGDEEGALELLRDVEPGMIFTERSGEALNGETLARRVRRSNMACRSAPIIMITNEATAAAIKGARDAGVHEFLRKPYTIGDIFKRVENVALKSRPWVEAVGYVGPDRRRFNSGEYSGARKRRADGASNEKIDVKDQALRILAAAIAQFDQDPAQAVRSIHQQAQTLKTVAVKAGDAKLAIAAGGLEAFMKGGAVTKAGLTKPIGEIMSMAAQAAPARMARAS